MIFQRNRQKQRGRIWQIWHKNRYHIRNRFEAISFDNKNRSLKIDSEINPANVNWVPELILDSTAADNEILSSEICDVAIFENPQPIHELLTTRSPSLSSLDSINSEATYIIDKPLLSAPQSFNLDDGQMFLENSSSKRKENEPSYFIEKIHQNKQFIDAKEFYLRDYDRNKIKPKIGNMILHSEWTNLYNDKLEQHYPLCVLRFNYHRINPKYKTRRSSYLIAEGNCKFKECLKFRFWIDAEPADGVDVRVKFLTNGSLSSQHHDNKTSFSRHLSGEIREAVKQKISVSSPINYHYEQFCDSKNISVARCGNFNNLHSPPVLRKIKAESSSSDRLSSDMWLDVVCTKKTYDLSIIGNFMNGYIQSMSRQPVVIHMYSEEQMLLLKHFKWDKITLHFDATGSVVRKIDKEQKTFLYYALTVRHPNAIISPIPLAEMLSSDHTNVEISHFLNKWLYRGVDLGCRLVGPFWGGQHYW